MTLPRDTCHLEEVLGRQPIGVVLFAPLTIHRLRGGDATLRSAEFAVTLRDIAGRGDVHRNLTTSWVTRDIAPTMAVQEKVITEWAAVGVACTVVYTYLGQTLSTVAMEGDRFDYWLSDGQNDFGLEVSGTIMESVETRHREKVAQLLANPFGVDGYVIVVGFATREVLCSFHRFSE